MSEQTAPIDDPRNLPVPSAHAPEITLPDDDLDGWIDKIVRPETTVSLYPYEVDYALKMVDLEQQIDAIEKAGEDADRGIDEPSAEALLAKVQELKAERERTAMKVTLRQVTDQEIAAAVKAAKAAGDTEGDDFTVWVIAESCVDKRWTVERLKRLRARDRSGYDMVMVQLNLGVGSMARGLPVPS